MCFLDITLPVKCAQFTGCNDAFAATGILGRSSWRQRQREEWAENQGQVAEGDTWFLISWNQLFWRPPKDLTRVYPFPLTLPFFFSRWYFNFLLFPGRQWRLPFPPSSMKQGWNFSKGTFTRKLKGNQTEYKGTEAERQTGSGNSNFWPASGHSRTARQSFPDTSHLPAGPY